MTLSLETTEPQGVVSTLRCRSHAMSASSAIITYIFLIFMESGYKSSTLFANSGIFT